MIKHQTIEITTIEMIIYYFLEAITMIIIKMKIYNYYSLYIHIILSMASRVKIIISMAFKEKWFIHCYDQQ